MSTSDVEFSRHYLTEVHKDVKRVPGLTGNLWKLAWVWTEGGKSQFYEFHGPEKFTYSMRATNAYEARARGWQAYIRQRHPELHAQLEKEAEEESAEMSQGPR